MVWGEMGRASGWGGQTSPRGRTFESLLEGARSLTPLHASDTTPPLLVTLDDSRSCGLWPFCSQRKIPERVGLLFGPEHLFIWHLLRDTGKIFCELPPPPTTVAGKEGMDAGPGSGGVWILLALMILGSVTLGKSLHPKEPRFFYL